MRERLGAVALACALHPARVLIGWGAAVAVGLISLPALQARLDESGFLVDGSDSAKVSARGA